MLREVKKLRQTLIEKHEQIITLIGLITLVEILM